MHDLERIMWSIIPFAIPVIALIGGMTVAVIKITGQQRLAELERKERIAMIERGVDPAKLPPIMSAYSYENGRGGTGQMQKAHGLMIGGMICIAVGIGLMVFLFSIEPNKAVWGIGLMPFLGGIALLISAKVIWPKPEAK